VRIAFGDCVVDRDTRELYRAGEVVHLPRKTFDLLTILLDARPRALSKVELQRLLWPDTFVSESNLSSLIAELRQAIGDRARGTELIRTVHGFGYAFAGHATQLAGVTVAADTRQRCRLVWGARDLPLQQGENLLGRAADVTCQIDSPAVSRHHARIAVTGGTATLEDLGSRNGTLLNGEPFESIVLLKDGDTIGIGPVALVFRVDVAGDTSTIEVDRV